MKPGSGMVARSRGFSGRELALTLLLLAAVVVIAIRVIDLRTKLLGVESDDPGPGGVLGTVARSVSRDVENASRGGAAPGERIRPVEDDTGARGPAVSRYLDTAGKAVLVRPGTDQLGLRGVMRAPFLAIRPGTGGDTAAFAERLKRDASTVVLSAQAPPSDPTSLDAVLERLGAPTSRKKRFVLVRDASGRYAVALLCSFDLSKEPPRAVDLRVDFAEPEAVSLNEGGAGEAAGSLGEPVSCGLLDDIVWFVAQGAPGRPPDYVASGDPPSMQFPHPFLAVAERAGEGRWEITRVGEDVEDFQVAWGLARDGAAVVWHGEKAGSPAPAAGDLIGSGRFALRAVRLAFTAKGEHRYTRADGPRPPPEFPPLLNGPMPGSVPGADPIGWDSDESRRVPFERASREVEVPVSGAGSSQRP